MSMDIARLAASSGTMRAAATSSDATSSSGKATTSTGNGVTTLQKSSGIADAFGMGADDFMQLFLIQLQNQDPTEPMDNKEMLTQLSQFTMISSLEKLDKALGGTQLAQASALIGDQVIGTDTSGKPASGVVDRIVQDSAGILLVLEGGAIVPPANVTQVLSATKSGTGSSATT
jgi:flagellar basal-body rod modification protein FlgD